MIRYDVYRAASPSGPFTLVGSTTGTKYVDRRLFRRTTYSYHVRAVDGVGAASAPSNTASITTR